MENKIVAKRSYEPNAQDLPSTEQLIRSTIFAAVASLALLVTVVMPAEYGIDPTGLGNLMGLKKMGEIRVSLDKEVKEEEAKAKASGSLAATKGGQSEVTTGATTGATETVTQPVSTASGETAQPAGADAAIASDEMQVTLAPDEGIEVKLVMNEGSKVNYSWSTDGAKANFDVHADSEELGIDYHQYGKGSEQSDEGELEAAFNGSHGWFWRNRSGEPLVITLKTEGQYTDLKQVQ
jgi:hypothetical protein